jgi:hypothetical protein
MLDLYDYYTLRSTVLVRAGYEGPLRVKVSFSVGPIAIFTISLPLNEFYPDGAGPANGFAASSYTYLICGVRRLSTNEQLACTYIYSVTA